MKKNIAIFLVISIGIFMIWNACQQVIGVITGISSAIPSRLINSEHYINRLEKAYREIDSYDFKRFEQHYKERLETEIKYLRIMQMELKKLSNVKLAEEV